MVNVLYITANPYDETKSFSMAVGKVFIETYSIATAFKFMIL